MNSHTPTRRRYDIVVAGARCAGAATAMLLARQGLKVLVVDRGRYGTDTMSTHALMRGGVLQLHHWGLLDQIREAGTPLVKTTSFYYGDEALPIPIKARDGIDGLYAPRRFVIDRLLVDAARHSGAEVCFGTRLVELRRADGRVVGAVLRGADGALHEIDAGIVVGADGGRSTVARLVGAEMYRQAEYSTGNVYGYWDGLGIDGYHWYFRPGVAGGAIATNDGRTLIFVSVPTDRFRERFARGLEAGFEAALAECAPGVAEQVARARQGEPLLAFRGVKGYFRQSHGPGWALVGDAGYFKDPLTAHGMTDAFIDAEVLANAIATGGDAALAEYQRLRDERAAGLFEATDQIASFHWDLDSVKTLHHSLSEAMKHELGFLPRRSRLAA